MSLKIGVFGTAHLHASGFVGSFLNHPDAEVAGVFDHNSDKGIAFANERSLDFYSEEDTLLDKCDAVVICSENMFHAKYINLAARSEKHLLCEKPIAPTWESVDEIRHSVVELDRVQMTSFPCPFSPVFQSGLKEIKEGKIGKIIALNATNQGICPFGWFVNPQLSGGGALIDHVVHVADLFWRILGEEPEDIFARIGNNHYQQDWDDTAMLKLSYPSGIFATLDSSWSKPKSYKTWGNVNLKVVGEKGSLEMELFNQGVGYYSDSHQFVGAGASLDQLMVNEFVSAIQEGRESSVTLEDGIRASLVALKGYESA